MRKFMCRLSVVLLSSASLVGLASTTPAQALPTCTKDVFLSDGGGNFRTPLPASGGGSWDCIMGVGSVSVAVATMQLSLAKCNGENITDDGNYGPKTRDAVREVQSRGDIPTDGVYGPKTRNVMRWLTYRDNSTAPPTCFNVEV